MSFWKKENKHDFPSVLEKIAFAFRQTRTHDDIVKNLLPILRNDMGVEEISFFFEDKSAGNYRTLTAEPRILSKENPLIKKMTDKKDIIVEEKILWAPSFSDDRLIAFFSLGEKNKFSEEDKKIFRAVAGLIATTLEYVVKPYLEVKEEFEISERKILQAEKELMRAHRLVALGTLTAGVAHEIRNPLAVLRSCMDVVRKQHEELPFIEEFYLKMIKHIDRIEHIIQKVLGLARDQNIRMEKNLDLNRIIEESVRFICFHDQVRLKKELSPLPSISGITEDLERAFINLIDNSQHAMPDGGTITIKTYTLPAENGTNQKAVAEINDTGIGIPQKNLDRIFDPFFTGRHEGTGLGLSIVYRIVKEHGGDISVKSVEGRGTTFKIELCVP